MGHQPELSNTQTSAGHSIFEKLSDPPGREATIQASTASKGSPRVVHQKSLVGDDNRLFIHARLCITWKRHRAGQADVRRSD